MKIVALILALIELISRCSITAVIEDNTAAEDSFYYIEEENAYLWHDMKIKSLNPHERPNGYADPMLTEKTALSVLQEASDMVNNVLIYSGIDVSKDNSGAMDFLIAYCRAKRNVNRETQYGKARIRKIFIILTLFPTSARRKNSTIGFCRPLRKIHCPF